MAEQNTEDKKISSKEIAIGAIQLFNDTGKKISAEIKNQPQFVFNSGTAIKYGIDVFDTMNKLNEAIMNYGYHVELDEYIDKKNVTKDSKYLIRITDDNKCYVEFSYFEYRDVMLDNMQSEQDYIYDRLIKMAGNEQNDLEEIAKLISLYLSFLCHFKELHIKVFNTLGWDYYDNQLIFKYDVIHHIPNVPSDKLKSDTEKLYIENVYRIQSRNEMDISNSLYCKENNHEEEIERWIWKLADVMNTSDKASLIIAAACTGLVRQLLPYSKEDNINMNIQGGPACGKSTICHFALSLFGDPQMLEGSFIDTENAMQLIRVQRPIVPYILDERMLKVEDSSEKAKRQAILLEVFREYEGKVKEKLAGEGKEFSGQRTNAPIISSSVEPMLDILLSTGRDLGQYRRFIEIEIQDKSELFEGNSKFANIVEAEAYTNYGFGVEIMVSYMLDKLNEDDEFVVKKYNKNCDEISEVLKQEENTAGLGSLLASSNKRFSLIVTTLDILMESILNRGGYLGVELNSNLHNNILKILVENLVYKMRKVKEAMSVDQSIRNNILEFIAKHKNMFTSQTTLWDGKNFVGQLSESEDRKSYIIKIPVGEGMEWLIEYGHNLSDEQIQDFVTEVNKSKEKAFELIDSILSNRIKDTEFKTGFIELCKRSGGEVTFEKKGKIGKNNKTLDQITVKKEIIETKSLKDSDKEDTKEEN